MRVVFRAVDKIPNRVGFAPIDARDRPGSRERVVFDGYLIAQQAVVGLVQSDPLANDGFVVLMQGHPALLERARSLEATRFDLQHVVAAVARARLEAVLADKAAGGLGGDPT